MNNTDNMKIARLTDKLSVSSQIGVDDIPAIVEAGFRTIINNRPDNEEPCQPGATEISAAAQSAGLACVRQPVISGSINHEDVQTFAEHLNQSMGPVLAFCRTGTRCCVLWLLNQRDNPDAALAKAREAGFNLDHLRPQLAGEPQPQGE